MTKPGLDQPVGAAAINRVPRQMITEALLREADAVGYGGGFAVVISIEGGEAAAKRTFNPHLGSRAACRCWAPAALWSR